MKRLIGAVAAAAVLAPAFVVGGSGQAFAATKTVQWKNKATGYCLSSIHDTVSTDKCNLRITNWRETKQADGTFILKNSTDGWCLDSRKNGTVYTHSCNGGNNQKWRETKDSLGWRLTNKATGKTIGVNTEEVYAGFDGGIKHQRWS
ncbi:RICIN domain-containing protein [Streptomyces sp. NPDC052496]|uniref:RICIN domain-containing protein n=1 Tax=Streptomyces sp. NPDC052496 TaxID=3154951 RepID=UPI003446EBD6